MNRNAITFIELLFVVIIIAILIGISSPQFRKTCDNFQQDNFIKDIYYLSRYLEASAIAETDIYCLNIDADKQEIWATHKGKNGFQRLKGKLGKVYQAPDGSSISIADNDKGSIYFYPDGSMDKARITLRNRFGREVVLSSKGASGVLQIQ